MRQIVKKNIYWQKIFIKKVFQVLLKTKMNFYANKIIEII